VAVSEVVDGELGQNRIRNEREMSSASAPDEGQNLHGPVATARLWRGGWGVRRDGTWEGDGGIMC
jgi:hypothetical protein